MANEKISEMPPAGAAPLPSTLFEGSKVNLAMPDGYETVSYTFQNLLDGVIAQIGPLQYEGTWNANTNSPTLVSSVGTKGFFYIVSVAGNTNLNGITTWGVGDWAVFNGTAWQKIDNTSVVYPIAVNLGGTGATSSAGARTNLGLVIGTDVQAHSSFLDSLSAQTKATGNITLTGTITTNTSGSKFVRDGSGGNAADIDTASDVAVFWSFKNIGSQKAVIGIENSAGAGVIGTPGAYSLSLATTTATGQIGFGVNLVITSVLDIAGRWLFGQTSAITDARVQVNGDLSFTGSGNSIKTDNVAGHTLLSQAYDTSDLVYRTFGTLTAGATPSLAFSQPSGGTLTWDGGAIGGTTAAPGKFTTLEATGILTADNAINGSQGADIASASTINLETATGNITDVTGTTTITAVTLSQGHERLVRFTGALTLTNGASLVLPSNANIITAAGDYAKFAGYAAGVVRVTEYTRADGTPLVPSVNRWIIISGSSTTMVSNKKYLSTFDDSSSTFALPTTTVVAGDEIQAIFSDTNDPNYISQQTGQTITLGGAVTTSGEGHGISTTNSVAAEVLLVATSSTNFNAYPINGVWALY